MFRATEKYKRVGNKTNGQVDTLTLSLFLILSLTLTLILTLTLC